jgi:hypothetical protein
MKWSFYLLIFTRRRSLTYRYPTHAVVTFLAATVYSIQPNNSCFTQGKKAWQMLISSYKNNDYYLFYFIINTHTARLRGTGYAEAIFGVPWCRRPKTVMQPANNAGLAY